MPYTTEIYDLIELESKEKLFRVSDIQLSDNGNYTTNVQWPIVLNIDTSNPCETSPGIKSAIETSFTLLSYIHPQFRRDLITSEIAINDTIYVFPASNNFIVYNGNRYTIAWTQVSLISLNGKLWNSDIVGLPNPFSFSNSYMHLFSIGAVIARREIPNIIAKRKNAFFSEKNNKNTKIDFITLNSGNVFKKLPRLSPISFIKGVYITNIQLVYPLLKSSNGYILPPHNIINQEPIPILPRNVNQTVAIRELNEHEKRCGESICIEYGISTHHYHRSRISKTGIVIVSEERYIYSTDAIHWKFTDWAGDLSKIIDSNNLVLTDSPKIDRQLAAWEVIPLTYARNLWTQNKYHDLPQESTIHDTIPVQLKLDYKLDEIQCFAHRCGWPYVVKTILASVSPECKLQNPIKFIDLIEKTFAWSRVKEMDGNETKHIWYLNKNHTVPYKELRMYIHDGATVTVAQLDTGDIVEWEGDWKPCRIATTAAEFSSLSILGNRVINEPWIGIWHNPHNMPSWFDGCNSPQQILLHSNFQESLVHCKGIIVLSEYLAKWVRDNIKGMPVSVLYHPTAKPARCFNLDDYQDNREKSVVQIGYWLRNFCAIGKLRAPGFRKIWLYGGQRALELLGEEHRIHLDDDLPCSDMRDVHRLRLSDSLYDEVLACNIAFVWLYDSSANNAIIECIARCTPLIVNNHPAAIEYLGENYPGLCTTLEEASALLLDTSFAKRAHIYLRDSIEIQDRITIRRFIHDFAKCEVVQALV
jgi:hypothetical protein